MQRLFLVVTFVTVLGACGPAQRTSPSTDIEFIYIDEGDDDDSGDPCLEAQVWPGDHDCLGRVPRGRQQAP